MSKQEQLTMKSKIGVVYFIDHENNDTRLEPCEMDPHHNRLAIEKLFDYEGIGTLEELKAAKEKQEAKKVIPLSKDCLYVFKCPVCGKPYSWETKHSYCDCGQKLDYSDVQKTLNEALFKWSQDKIENEDKQEEE